MPIKFGFAKSTPPKPNGKGGSHVMLPNREALAQLTKGNPVQQSLGNYAKLTPSGAGAMAQPYSTIEAEGEKGVSVEP